MMLVWMLVARARGRKKSYRKEEDGRGT